MILTPKIVGPEHLVEVIGSLDLTVPAVGAVVRSGGRHLPFAATIPRSLEFGVGRAA